MNFDLRNNRDFIAGLLFIAVGVLAVAVARDYPFGTAMRMGSGYFPSVLGGILILLGAWVMVRGLRSGEKLKGEWGWKPLALIALSIALFGALMQLGLIPALVAVLFVSAYAGREFRFKEVLVLTAVLCVFAVVVLLYVLKMPYPLIAGYLWIS